jgi:hypothetical protein
MSRDKMMRCVLICGLILFMIGGSYLAIAGETTVTVVVIDELENPIEGATVHSGWGIPPPDGFGLDYTHRNGITGSNGICTLPLGGRVHAGVGAGKDGYYGSGQDLEKLLPHPVLMLNRPVVTITLLKKLRPVPMYVRNVAHMRYSKVPLLNGDPCGFDLIKRDWLPPHGSGEVADWIISHRYDRRGEYDWDGAWTIAFSNPDDGIQHMKVPFRGPRASSLRLPREAPEDGYLSHIEWVEFVHAVKDQHRNSWTVKEAKGFSSEDDNYIFRIRTRRNDQGEVIGGMYGKIHGPFFNDQSRFYLNPDGARSLEWNGQNLFGELPADERLTPEP